jgi:HEAT repeat protein
VTAIAAAAAAGLGAAVALVALFLVVARAFAARRRSREHPLRERFELGLAMFLAVDASRPDPTSEQERRVLRSVALVALEELRGSERARVTAVLDETGIIEEAIMELRSRRVSVRRDGAETLAQARLARGAEALVHGLEDRDRGVALTCARGLAELGDKQALPRILTVAEEAGVHAPGAVAELLLALGAHAPAVLDDVYRGARAPSLRRLAIAVIGELRLVEHAPVLHEALREDDDELVARAARGLGAIGDAEMVLELVRLVADPQRVLFVRAQAATALGRIGDPATADALERALTDGSWLLHERAATALRELGAAGHAALERAARAGDVHAKAALA